MKLILEKGRKSVPIGTRVALPGGKYYREKTATGWRHVKVARKEKKQEEGTKKRVSKDEDEEVTDKKKELEDKKQQIITAWSADKLFNEPKARKTLTSLYGAEFAEDVIKKVMENRKGVKLRLTDREKMIRDIRKKVRKETKEPVGGKDEKKAEKQGDSGSADAGDSGKPSGDSGDKGDQKKEAQAEKRGRGRPKGTKKKLVINNKDTELNNKDGKPSKEALDAFDKQWTEDTKTELKAEVDKKVEALEANAGRLEKMIAADPDNPANIGIKAALESVKDQIKDQKSRLTAPVPKPSEFMTPEQLAYHMKDATQVKTDTDTMKKQVVDNLPAGAKVDDKGTVTPVVTPKQVDKAVGTATPETRTAVDAAVNGGQVGVEPKPVKYEFKPAKVTVKIPNNGTAAANTLAPDIECEDYSGAESINVHLVSVKNVLATSKPSYIPELGSGVFRSIGGRMVATKLPDGNYLMLVGKKADSFGYSNSTTKSALSGNTYAKVSLEVLCATQDYYSKQYKARVQEEIKQKHAAVTGEIAAMKRAIEDMKKMTPEEIKAKGSDFEYKVSRAKSLYDYFQKNPAYEAKYIKSNSKFKSIKTLGSNKMTYYENDLHNAFTGHKSARGFVDAWAAHSELMDDMKIKSNDMALQFDENFSVYHKGEETSYGNKGTKDTLLATHGVKVKRQNGDEINDKEIAEVKTALDSVFSVFGNRSDMAKKWGLKISHSGMVGMHARKASGIFFPHFHAIGVSFGGHDGGMTLAHEWSHFMDNYVGKTKGHHYASDDWNSSAGQMAVKLRAKLKSTSDYANRTCECFARSMESYFAYKTGGEDAVNELHTAYTEKYYPKDLEYMKKEVYPLCEQFLKEHDQTLKSMQVRLMIKLEKSEILAGSLKREGKYKEGMKKTWTQEQEDEGAKVEMEHTDNPEVARQIAMDHLIEDSDYYAKLKKMEAGE